MPRAQQNSCTKLVTKLDTYRKAGLRQMTGSTTNKVSIRLPQSSRRHGRLSDSSRNNGLISAQKAINSRRVSRRTSEQLTSRVVKAAATAVDKLLIPLQLSLNIYGYEARGPPFSHSESGKRVVVLRPMFEVVLRRLK